MKYIVRNCPSCFRGGCYGCDNLCQNITDCSIKQIVNECKKYSYIFSERGILASLILQILKVDEVEE